jgi:thioredoxin reductase
MSSMSDVLIVGGSYGGLSVALTLYRALHTCVIFDSHSPRNAKNTKLHLMPTWDNKTPEQFFAAAKEELRGSGLISFRDTMVENIERLEDGTFRITDSAGQTWDGRKVVLACGVAETFPSIEGYTDCYTNGMWV